MIHSAFLSPFILYDTNRPRPRMIDWSIDWREWFDIQERDSAAMIDWSQCPDAESVPDRCGGAWVVKRRLHHFIADARGLLCGDGRRQLLAYRADLRFAARARGRHQPNVLIIPQIRMVPLFACWQRHRRYRPTLERAAMSAYDVVIRGTEPNPAGRHAIDW
jgi:hypothetical protein